MDRQMSIGSRHVQPGDLVSAFNNALQASSHDIERAACEGGEAKKAASEKLNSGRQL